MQLYIALLCRICFEGRQTKNANLRHKTYYPLSEKIEQELNVIRIKHEKLTTLFYECLYNIIMICNCSSMLRIWVFISGTRRFVYKRKLCVNFAPLKVRNINISVPIKQEALFQDKNTLQKSPHCCFDGASLLPNALRTFRTYCAPPNLGITRT